MSGKDGGCYSRSKLETGVDAQSEGSSALLGSTDSFRKGMNSRKKTFTAPTCNCETYAILFKSSTIDNLNRPFFGCAYFKTRISHRKFFAWMDEYVTSFHAKDITSSNKLVNQFKRLEEKLESMELLMTKDRAGMKSNSTKCKTISTLLVEIVVTLSFWVLFNGLYG
ncbi:GRF zinc finger protein [Arachis hypogaea]|nr:GRF zinc finger protein [Arachis hypogaea]